MSSDRIVVSWQVDATDPEKPLYCLVSEHPDYPELRVSILSSEVTERAARAKLIEQMFNKAHSLGLDVTRLRFHV